MIGQLTLAPIARLPLDPHELINLDSSSRGQLYNDLDLCPLQRGCAEEARRMLIAGTYDQPNPKEKQ